jgi:hypothetical protein
MLGALALPIIINLATDFLQFHGYYYPLPVESEQKTTLFTLTISHLILHGSIVLFTGKALQA